MTNAVAWRVILEHLEGASTDPCLWHHLREDVWQARRRMRAGERTTPVVPVWADFRVVMTDDAANQRATLAKLWPIAFLPTAQRAWRHSRYGRSGPGALVANLT